MKIYFTASARGCNKHGDDFKRIFRLIENSGHKNLDYSIISPNPEDLYKGNYKIQADLYEQAMRKIRQADVVILEVTVHSLSMGFVMHAALDLGKPVIALHKKDSQVFFASGVNDERLQVVEYTKHSLSRLLKSALQYAKDNSDVRFNLTIPPKIAHYLDWISKRKKMPRAVYIRHSLEKMMLENEEYSRNLTLGS